MDIAQLWNCKHAFDAPCPKSWAALASTDNDSVRHCETCDQDVTYCSTPEEFVSLGNAGKCVAVPNGYSPSTLQMMIMGRPSREAVQKLKAQQAQIEEWWSTALESHPEFAAETFTEIESTIRTRRRPPHKLSADYRAYLEKLGAAVQEGPEALYLHLRIRPSGKREKQQNIFHYMRTHFPMSFREFKRLADRLDKKHPL